MEKVENLYVKIEYTLASIALSIFSLFPPLSPIDFYYRRALFPNSKSQIRSCDTKTLYRLFYTGQSGWRLRLSAPAPVRAKRTSTGCPAPPYPRLLHRNFVCSFGIHNPCWRSVISDITKIPLQLFHTAENNHQRKEYHGKTKEARLSRSDYIRQQLLNFNTGGVHS